MAIGWRISRRQCEIGVAAKSGAKWRNEAKAMKWRENGENANGVISVSINVGVAAAS